MTLSNFDWTDKDSLRWFIMLPTGHEGPYSLEDLASRFAKKRIGPDSLVWAEGLTSPVALKTVFLKASSEEEAREEEEDELPPPLPPLPDEDVPPVPFEEAALPSSEQSEETEDQQTTKPRRKLPIIIFLVIFLTVLGAFLGWQWLQGQENFSIRRYPKMSMEVFNRIQKSLSFEGWDKKIFFKEFVPADLSHIWLVTSSYQACDVSASFSSLPGKLISLEDNQIVFKASGKLRDHVVQFSEFQFEQGTRILPGMYQMKVQAKNCKWDGIVPSLANGFAPPDETYEASTNVVLYEKGADEFNKILDELNRKKLEKERQSQHLKNQFWDDLQQKLQTLLAISLQVEQSLIDFVEGRPNTFAARLKPMIENYTQQYGHFLTNFVNANEAYFQELNRPEVRQLALKKNFQEMIARNAKEVGLTAMRIIEELQSMKNPSQAQLNRLKQKITRSFAQLKTRINRRILEVTEDRASSP